MILRLLALLAIVAIASWLYKDARGRGLSTALALLVFIGCLFFPIIIIPIYLIFRPRHSERANLAPAVMCPKCGQENVKGQFACSNCNNTLSM